MQPMLDDLFLPQVQVIRSYDKRMLSEHRATGMDGSFLQNMGRRPSCVMLAGIASGSDALEFIEKLDDKFNQREAVTFITDIVIDSEIEEMLIDDFKLEELAGKPDRFAYVLTLREHIEPLEPESVTALNANILDDANSLLEDLVDGLDLGLTFPTGLEQFLDPLVGLLTRLRAFNQSVNQGN